MADTFSPVLPAADGDAAGSTGGDNPSYASWGQYFQAGQRAYGLVLNPTTGFYEPRLMDGIGPTFAEPHGAAFVFQPVAGSNASTPIPGIGAIHEPANVVSPAISDPVADVLNGPHGGAAPAVFDTAAGDSAKATILSKPAIPAHFTIGL